MRVTAVIVDDEPVAREGLRAMLSAVTWVSCVGEAASGPAAIEAIDRLRPDLAFVDIQLPGFLGTELLRRLRHQPHVVFTTAFAQHAVTAFELGALDYLLKPFGPDRLAKTLERVRAALGEPPGPPPVDRLREALARGPLSRLFVRVGGAVVPFAVSGVSRFEAAGDYVTAHAGRSRHVLHLSLNRLEARLDPARFVRIHRAHLVNLDHVTAFRRAPGGELVAELDNGDVVAVSRARARQLRGLAV